MTTLSIDPVLAERLHRIAELEQRSIDALLESLLTHYEVQESARPHSIPGLQSPIQRTLTPPLSDAELEEVAQRVGSAGSLSAFVIEERRQGW